MLVNEILKEVGMTRRAIKYYEEKGLLSIKKGTNGYRNYTDEDVKVLKKISVYRKLGISIEDIKNLLNTNDRGILIRVYNQKLQEKQLQESELEALKDFIDNGNPDKANEVLDYTTIESAIESMFPDEAWAEYLNSHFKPFLNVRIKTPEQKQALENILEYCENTTLKTPFMMKLGIKLTSGILTETRTADEMIAYYRDMSDGEYKKLSVNLQSCGWQKAYLRRNLTFSRTKWRRILLDFGHFSLSLLHRCRYINQFK